MFKTRCISAVFLVIIALVTLLMGGPVLALTLYAISMIAFFELARACKIHTQVKCNALEAICYLAITVYYGMMYAYLDDTLFVPWLIVFFFAVLFVYVFSFPKFTANQIMAAYFCVLYAPVMFSFIYKIRQTSYGIYLVWMVFVASWVSDTFAYLTGMLFGRHKLAPVLSPKKSIEGSIGGIVGSALAGMLFGYFFGLKIQQGNTMIFICGIIGAVGSVISQLGDLAASAIKRNHEMKDYGKLIPGHGGIMDRFDSVIVTAPMIYFLVIYLIH